MSIPSRLIEEAVNEVSKLPGIGKKTALRLVLHMLKEDKGYTFNISQALTNLRENVKYCKHCHNISDHEECDICVSNSRDRAILCVVEDIRDVMAIENTHQYNGLYHVLGGVISPIERVGPSDLKVDTLLSRIPGSEIKEVILALSPTMEGDTTAFYLSRKLKEATSVKVSTTAKGIPMGGELEYMDEVTLGRSITARTYES